LQTSFLVEEQSIKLMHDYFAVKQWKDRIFQNICTSPSLIHKK